MRIFLPLIIVFCTMASNPAFAQPATGSLFFQLSYGQSFFRSNSSPGYTYVCPEVKLGLGIIREKNRFGFSTAALVGIRYGATKDLPYQMFVSEARLYMQLQEHYYSSAFEFVEIPITIHYQIVEERLSIHTGVSTRWYFTENFVASGFQGFLEEIQVDRFNVGILSAIKINLTPRIGVSVDYLLGLKKLNVAKSLQQDMTYHVNGSFAQMSFYYNFLKARRKE